MIIRKINPTTRDWQFGKGLSGYATAEAAIEENIQTRILSWTSDCFFALADGIDWRSRLDVGQQRALRDEIAALILKSFGVVAVNSVDMIFDAASRLETVKYNIDTIYSSNFQAAIAAAAGTPGS